MWIVQWNSLLLNIPDSYNFIEIQIQTQEEKNMYVGLQGMPSNAVKPPDILAFFLTNSPVQGAYLGRLQENLTLHLFSPLRECQL